MNIIQDSTEKYGDVKFTLTPEDKKIIKGKIIESIESCTNYEPINRDDARILVWILTNPNEFTSETISYSNITLTRIKHWLNQ